MNKYLIRILFFSACLMFSSFEHMMAQCNNIFQFNSTPVPATCLTADGSIAITGVTGGSGTYTFSLLGGPALAPNIPPNGHNFTPLSAGVYTITISDGTCDTTITVTVEVTGSITNASATVTPTSCTSNTGTITVSHLPASVNVVTYTISPAPPPPNATGVFTGLAAGSYDIILEDANGCPFALNGVVIAAPDPITDADVQVTPIQCKGALGVIEVAGVTGGTAPFLYSLNGSAPSTIKTWDNLNPLPYTITIIDANNCTYNENVIMTGSLTELTDCSAGKDTTIFFGENVKLNAVKGVGQKAFWSPGDLLNDSLLMSPIAFPPTTTTFTFTTKTPEGCTCVDRMTVTVIPLIKIPNTFTPNQDGINDIWIIENTILYEDVNLFVYNRWGDKVYEVKGYETGKEWDGGSLPAATYYYVLRFKFPGEDKIYEYTGGITIVR